MNTGPVIEAHDVTLRHGRSVVLTIPSLTATDPGVILLRGPNGSGKSTFLRALAGEMPATGTLKVVGHLPGTLPMRRISVFVPTDPILPEDLAVHEYLSYVALAYGAEPDSALQAAHAFGLTPWLNDAPHALSRGTRQKVALAAAFGISRPVTLLDEPLANLDVDSAAACLTFLDRERTRGHTVIVSDHSGLVERLADQVWTLAAGNLSLGRRPESIVHV